MNCVTSIYLFTHLFIYLHIYLYIYTSIYVFTHLSINLSVHPNDYKLPITITISKGIYRRQYVHTISLEFFVDKNFCTYFAILIQALLLFEFVEKLD